MLLSLEKSESIRNEEFVGSTLRGCDEFGLTLRVSGSGRVLVLDCA